MTRGQEFDDFLKEKRREFERMGAPQMTVEPNFEETVRHQWENEQDDHQLQCDKDVEGALFRCSEVARRRLISHGFAQPFQIEEDPKY